MIGAGFEVPAFEGSSFEFSVFCLELVNQSRETARQTLPAVPRRGAFIIRLRGVGSQNGVFELQNRF